MKQILVIIISIVLFGQVYSQTKEVPFTLDDRDRIMRTEIELNSFRKEVNARFEAINSKFDALDYRFDAIDHKFDAINSRIDTLFWVMGIAITLIIFLFGYIIFDRRTGIKPLEKDISVIKNRLNNISEAIKELAHVDTKFAQAIKKVAL